MRLYLTNLIALPIAISVAVSSGLSGCATKRTEPEETEIAHRSMLTDTQILGILLALNQGEIDAAQLALKQSADADVRALAQRMIADHQNLARQVYSISDRIDVAPADSPLRQQLQNQTAQAMQRLGTLSPSAFAQAYMDSQIAMHRQAIDVVNQQLLPQAETPNVKELLIQTRPPLHEHLEEAQKAVSPDTLRG